jgi:glutathione S-transferase
MFILYYKPSCPFCQRVLQVAENLGVAFDLKDISDDEVLASELVARGGKRQVPYLVDSSRHVEMYESNDIIEYIREHRPAPTAPSKPHLHVGGATCIACEG